jgi:aminomethyltransferase
MNQNHRTRKTALYEEHTAAGGRMVEFAGFELPVQYTGIAEEHRAVRERAGLFDVSHMGEIVVRGPGALDFLQLVSCNDHAKMSVGRAQYTGLM